MGFLYDPTWYAIDSPRGLADQATAMLQALEAGHRDDVKLAELVGRASDAYASRFPDDVDWMAPSVSEWVMRDRPRKADVLSCEVPYRRRMRWILILLVLAACPRKSESDEERKEGYVKQMEPIIAAHKAPATAKLEAMRAVMKMLATAPHVDQREALGPGVACTLDTCERTYPGDDPTARWKAIENILRTGYDENTAAPSVEDSLRKLEAIKYFVVIRTHSYDPPVPGDQPDRYLGGHAAGDVAIYDLATRTRVGGFPWEVGAPDVASIDPKADRKSELDHAMRGSIALKTDDAIMGYLAGKAASPPPSAPANDPDLRERQIKELLINKQMIVDSVEIVEKPSCRVVLRTFITTGIALHPPEGFGEGDGIVQPAATELVNKVMGKECAVSYQLAK